MQLVAVLVNPAAVACSACKPVQLRTGPHQLPDVACLQRTQSCACDPMPCPAACSESRLRQQTHVVCPFDRRAHGPGRADSPDQPCVPALARWRALPRRRSCLGRVRRRCQFRLCPADMFNGGQLAELSFSCFCEWVLLALLDLGTWKQSAPGLLRRCLVRQCAHHALLCRGPFCKQRAAGHVARGGMW